MELGGIFDYYTNKSHIIQMYILCIKYYIPISDNGVSTYQFCGLRNIFPSLIAYKILLVRVR